MQICQLQWVQNRLLQFRFSQSPSQSNNYWSINRSLPFSYIFFFPWKKTRQRHFNELSSGIVNLVLHFYFTARERCWVAGRLLFTEVKWSQLWHYCTLRSPPAYCKPGQLPSWTIKNSVPTGYLAALRSLLTSISANENCESSWLCCCC